MINIINKINKKIYIYINIIYKLFDKKTSGGTVKNENISNKELAEELHKPIIKKFKKSTFTFYRQYMGRRSSRYAINK